MRSEIDRNAAAFVIAVTDGFRPVATAKFGRQVQGGGVAAALFGLGQGAPGFGGQILAFGHGEFLRLGLDGVNLGKGRGLDKRRNKQAGTSGKKGRVDEVRLAAVELLGAVSSGATLDEAAGVAEHLPPAGRARARRLAGATLRHLGRADAVLQPLLSRRPRPDILWLMRLATVEMLALGEAPHGAVNAAVDLARSMGRKGQAAAGMVNAVLRRASQQQADWAGLSPQPLPTWLRRPIAAAWSETVVRAIEAAHEVGAPIDITAKPGVDAPGQAMPTGSYRQPSGAQVSALPGYEQGDWWVQDAAAAMAVRVLAPVRGEVIADLCAAPGGKTLQLAASGAEVTAIDISDARLSRVAENLARCGLQARLIAADALDWRPEAPLDAVLLDAPCSATGTIRRHPELPLIRDGSGLADLTHLQARLIDHALTLLRPGGRLVYATCSLLPAEGEDQLAAALSRHPDLIVQRPDLPGIAPEWITTQGGLRLRPDYWPDEGGMDGFFIACLRKPGSAP